MVLLSARGNCRGSNERVRSNAVGVLFGISLVRDGQTIVDTLERMGWVIVTRMLTGFRKNGLVSCMG